MVGNEISVIIGGDLGPTKSNYSIFSKGNIKELITGELYDLLSLADFRIFNLEVPLTNKENPISKDGPNLISPISTINGIKSLNPSVLCLGNNHIMDHGEQGLFQTQEQLSKFGILSIGAGRNIAEAATPVILARENLRIGIYSCTENEFSIARQNIAGANPFDPLESPDHITKLKNECDFVIVLHHGGKEQYRYPTPELQKVCRKMISKGADLVVCQHSHCVGSYELFENGTIIYGQGNFLFDRHDNDYYQTGLVVNVKPGAEKEVEFIPIQKEGNGVKLADRENGERILAGFFQRSEEIKTPGFVELQFDQYCRENGQYYLATLAGLGKTIRRIDKVLNRPLTRLIYSGSKLNTIRNHFECETHREIVLRYIEILKTDKLP